MQGSHKGHRHGPAAFPGDQRGMTLTELAIVGTLAILVMLSLTGFYFNSQKLWMSGSTQAMAQRDATLIVDVVSRMAHAASQVVVEDVDGPLRQKASLFVPGPGGVGTVPIAGVGWDPGDQRIHAFDEEGGVLVDRGPIADSRALQFKITPVDSTLVQLTCLELLTAEGDTVRVATRFALLSR